MKEFKDKVAVITGGASGIGLAIAKRLGREGVKLVLADVEQPALEQAVTELRGSGFDVIGHVTEVAKYEQVQALAERSFAHYGAVHFLFNNAGVVFEEAADPWDISINTWQWGLGTNLWGVIHGIKAFMPRLVAQNQEAWVVNVTSLAGALITLPIIPVYSATKAAMTCLTESLYFRLKQLNSPVKAMLLSPGPHTIPTRTYTSWRNRPADLPPEPQEPTPQVSNLEEMQQWMMERYGRMRDTTSAEDVAEQCYQALRADKYFVAPMSERFQQAYRKRFEENMAGLDPSPIDVM